MMEETVMCNDHELVQMAKRLATRDDRGLVVQALLEFEGSGTTPFGWLSFPPPQSHIGDVHPATWFAEQCIQPETTDTDTSEVQEDKEPAHDKFAIWGALALPLLVLISRPTNETQTETDCDLLISLARRHLRCLLKHAPRSPETGAISSSLAELSVSALSIFTVVPFLAWSSLCLYEHHTLTEAIVALRAYMTELRTSGPLLLDTVCAHCSSSNKNPAASHPRCACVRRPTALGNALAVAGMLRLLGVLLLMSRDPTNNETDMGWDDWSIADSVRFEANRLLSDILPILHHSPQAGAGVDEETNLIHARLDDATSPPDVGATALLVADIYHLGMLWPEAVSDDHLAWAAEHYDAVTKWVDDEPDGEIRRKTGEPSCMTYCCILMMMGARRKFRSLEVAQRREATNSRLVRGVIP